MTITLEAIRAAGGIVHSDGNIFFRDISMLQGLAGAAPAAVAPQDVVAWMHPETLNVISAAHKHDMSTEYGAETRRKAESHSVALVRAGEPAVAAPALEAPPAVAPQGEYPHEQMDAMALARYKVVPSHASMLWSHAVVAGDGAQQLYGGREVECQNMARKFAGAFLDGAFAFHSMAAAPTAQAAPALEAPAAPAVPVGFALVPIEPTQQMLDAGRWSGAGSVSIQEEWARKEVWSRMLATVTPPPAAYADDLVALVENLAQALSAAAPDNDLAGHALDYLKRNGLQGSPLREDGAAPQAPAAPETHAGLLAAAAHIQAKAQAHLDERGSYDPDTGAVEMSESNQEHFNTLDELAEEIRMMAEKATPASCDKPPAGWNCSRAPGHDGPCAAAPAAPAVDESFEDLISDWAHGDALDAEHYRTLSQAARDVLAERRRQVNAEGFSPERDDQYVGGQLAGAAISYLILAAGGREDEARAFWPWRQEWLKPGSQRRYLEKACALGLAEMERMDRSAALANGGNSI